MSGLTVNNKSCSFPENGGVGDGGGDEEDAVAADLDHVGRREAHVARQQQLWIEWRNGEMERLGKLFIESGRRDDRIFMHSFHVSFT